jgi:hypothetical protein
MWPGAKDTWDHRSKKRQEEPVLVAHTCVMGLVPVPQVWCLTVAGDKCRGSLDIQRQARQALWAVTGTSGKRLLLHPSKNNFPK